MNLPHEKTTSKRHYTTQKLASKCTQSAMAASWVLELQSLVEDNTMPINIRAAKAMACLRANGLAHQTRLRPKELLVHTSNRGGQMVNCFDVVSKGQAICEVGWDINKIREPVAFELSADSDKRHAMVAANLALAQQSNGMLAMPCGKERCCSISASHTTSFLKALEAGCYSTPMAKQDDLEKLLEEGWEWTCIASTVEDHIPALPNLLQQAFNSDGGILKPPTELEVMLTISKTYEMQPAQKKDLQKAVAQAGSSMPPCKGYMKHIGDFVGSFAGGEQFKLLKYLDFIGCLSANNLTSKSH